ncbi:HVO_A0114 family putative DNA-binding protein [Halomarina pelagica]|uniref:HVO_A0114 family putative DNA-binding protein n=1 Tax=Halomarina pelagica TaxID=2961599 RepID=UPI003F62A3D9
MRTSNLELVKSIASKHPESISEAAAAVDREYREVHQNLAELESLGVIEFETSGQQKQPILRRRVEAIEVSIQFPS